MPTTSDVEKFLSEKGVEVRRFESPTPTSETAARAVGCSVGEIAKTLLFIIGEKPVVVVTSGDTRVRGSALKRALGLAGKVRLPGHEEVEAVTGYLPGGVCPFLLPEGLPVVLDVSLRRFAVVYPAAGDDHSGVPLTFDRLKELTGGAEADVCQDSA